MARAKARAVAESPRPGRQPRSAGDRDPTGGIGTEIAAGFYSWETYFPKWRAKVRSAASLTNSSVGLIDPLIPPGAAGRRFWGEQRGRPLRLCPTGWLPEGVSWAALSRAVQLAGGLPVEILHLGHEAPILSGAREALGAAARSRR